MEHRDLGKGRLLEEKMGKNAPYVKPGSSGRPVLGRVIVRAQFRFQVAMRQK